MKEDGVRRGLAIRSRLAVLLTLVTATAAAVTAGGGYVLTARALDGRLDARLDRLEQGVHIDLRLDSVALTRRLERARALLVADGGATLERLLDPSARSSPTVVAAADRIGSAVGLEILEILDATGVVLSSRHFAERTGESDPWALELLVGVPRWRRLDRPAGKIVAIVSRHAVDVGRHRLELVGGVAVDEMLVFRRTDSTSVVLFVSASGATVHPPGHDDLEPLAGLGADEHDTALRAADRSWSARGVPVGDPGVPPAGRFILAVDREPVESALADLRVALGTLVLLAVAVGAVSGRWLARRATRPVEETIRAVDAIAAGEADYGFSRHTADELEDLPESFSRLHRSLEEQQRRRAAAERVAAWREVARRVAHEVKNPLAPIRLTVQNMIKARRKAPAIFDEVFEDGTRAILEEVEQLQRLVTEFSEFARLPESRPTTVDLDGVVDSVLALYAGEDELVVERRGAGEPGPVLADADLLARAIKNLVANAVEAMGENGGTLVVQTGRAQDGAAFVRIADRGTGFTDEALERLFEPYFTTKPSGTGLGMAIAYRIVSEQGGTLTASNRAGGGAEVVVTLAKESVP